MSTTQAVIDEAAEAEKKSPNRKLISRIKDREKRKSKSGAGGKTDKASVEKPTETIERQAELARRITERQAAYDKKRSKGKKTSAGSMYEKALAIYNMWQVKRAQPDAKLMARMVMEIPEIEIGGMALEILMLEIMPEIGEISPVWTATAALGMIVVPREWELLKHRRQQALDADLNPEEPAAE